jgi:hypothetical protein
MHGDRPSHPGAVRRWWWRSSQRQRLATAGSATVLGLVVLGVALASVETAPASSAADPAVPRPSAVGGDPVSTTPSSDLSGPVILLTTTAAPTVTAVPVTSTSRRAGVTTNQPPSLWPGPPTLPIPTWLPPTSWPVITPILPITPTSPPGGGVQRGARIGEPCSPEGARGITDQGEFLTCEPANLGPRGPADVWRQE